MKKIIILFVFFLSGLMGLLFSLYIHRSVPSVDTVPVIETFHSPAIFVKQLQGDPLAGEKIFQAFCGACHADRPLIDIAAPHLHDKKTWNFKRKIGEKALLAITINGAGLMPARGGCFECSDAQLQEAIRYILRESKSVRKKGNIIYDRR